MYVTIKSSDLSKNNPIAYRIAQDTGIPEDAIEFYRGYIRFVRTNRNGRYTVLGYIMNNDCLKKFYDDIYSMKSPKAGCTFEIPNSYIISVRWYLGEKDDYYGFDVDYGEL